MARDESLYNLAQENEVFVFLNYLPKAIEQVIKDIPRNTNTGRRPFPLFDILVSLCMQHYIGFSDRRSIGMIKLMTNAAGIRIKVPSFATLNRYRRDPFIKSLLAKLIEVTSRPMAMLEKDFATDSTGASTSNRSSWYNIRTGKRQTKSDHVNAHVTVGTVLNAAVAIDIDTEVGKHNVYLREHVKRVAKLFTIKDWLGDTAYCSRRNCDAVAAVGGSPWFKPRAKDRLRAAGVPAWRAMQKAFKEMPEEAKGHYHKRSAVESANSAKKRKFGSVCKTRLPEAQENEEHLKWIAYNFSVLSRAHYEYGIRL